MRHPKHVRDESVLGWVNHKASKKSAYFVEQRGPISRLRAREGLRQYALHASGPVRHPAGRDAAIPDRVCGLESFDQPQLNHFIY